MPFYRRHPLAMVFLRLAVSVAMGAWVMFDPPPGFDRTRTVMLACFIGFAAAWAASFATVWACEGWRTACTTRFLEV
jgi:hypothetical protein